MNETDRDKLLELGYNLLKEHTGNSIFVFENNVNLNFSVGDNLSEVQYVLSDVLTF